MDKNRMFTEEHVWTAIYQAAGECYNDSEFIGLLVLAEAILGIPYKEIKTMLEKE